MSEKINRRDFLKLTTAGALSLPQVFSSISCRTKGSPPNIIFILSDDHACRAISAYGSRLIQTPHLDRLANEGLRFDCSFATNSICAPSRASILTGQYSNRHGVIDNSLEMKSQEDTFPVLLKKAGYQTALVGKWHLKATPFGFDYFSILPDQGDYYNPDFIEKGRKYREPGYVTDLITEKCLAWIKNRDKSKPFLLFMNHKAPHRNWMPGPQTLHLYRNEDLPVPETFFDDYRTRCEAARQQEMRIADHAYLSYDLKLFPMREEELNEQEKTGLAYWHSVYNRLTDSQKKSWEDAYQEENEEFRRKKLEGQELALWKYQRYIKDYLRCIASVDLSVGRLLDFLDKESLTNNTMVIYASDQGFFLGEHGWFDKRFMYEPSIRFPLLMRYPDGIERKVDQEHLILNGDLAPTILEMAGLRVPDDMQGKSFKDILQGKKVADWRESFYYHYYEYPAVHSVKRHYGVRTSRYKLIHFYYDIDCWELYDLQTDPQEVNNLYNHPDYLQVQENLIKELNRWKKELGVKPEI
ncbi:MAG: sulfatase/phosphatase domain-containing protein [Candidatus Saccharicenans sp.]